MFFSSMTTAEDVFHKSIENVIHSKTRGVEAMGLLASYYFPRDSSRYFSSDLVPIMDYSNFSKLVE